MQMKAPQIEPRVLVRSACVQLGEEQQNYILCSLTFPAYSSNRTHRKPLLLVSDLHIVGYCPGLLD